MSYRPLPPNLTIKPSPIEGLGLFALQLIPYNDLYLGISHVYIIETGDLVRTPLGGFINHSKEPNCSIIKMVETHHNEAYMLRTDRPIEEGEELLVDYDNCLTCYTKEIYENEEWKEK